MLPILGEDWPIIHNDIIAALPTLPFRNLLIGKKQHSNNVPSKGAQVKDKNNDNINIQYKDIK